METFVGLIFWGVIGYFAYKHWKKKKSENDNTSSKINQQSPFNIQVSDKFSSQDKASIDDAIESIPLSKFRGIFPPDRFNNNKRYYAELLCPTCEAKLPSLPKQSGTCRACKSKFYMRVEPYSNTDILLNREERDFYISSMDSVYSIKRLIKESLTFDEIKELTNRPEQYIDEALVHTFLKKTEEYLAKGHKGFYRNSFNKIRELYENLQGEEYLKHYLTVLWIDASMWDKDNLGEPAPLYIRNFDNLLTRYSLTDKDIEKVFFTIANDFQLSGTIRTPQKAWWKIMQCVRDYRKEQELSQGGKN